MATNVFKCTPRRLRRCIIECMDAGLVPSIESSPGIGKSSIVRSIANDFDLQLIDHRLSTSEPTDMTGLPDFDKEGYAYYAPFKEIFPLSDAKIPDGKNGWIIFFDEYNAAPKSVQAASYKVVLDRMIGQHKLHPNVAMVMAGNLVTDRAIVNPLSTAMQSRLIHFELECNFNEWLLDVALPQKYDSRIIAFLSQFESKLMDFKPDHSEKTFCCPRTWEFVNRLLTKKDKDDNITAKTLNEDSPYLLTGAITYGVALEFIQFTKVYQDMINVRDIVSAPLTCPLPRDLNLKWAVITHMTEKADDHNLDALATYADRFEMSMRVLFYRMMLARKKELRTHKDFGPHVAKIMNYINKV